MAVFDAHAVGKTPVRLEQIGIALVAAETETGGDVERHLMAAMGNAPPRRPAVTLEHRQRAQVLDQAVAQRAIELQPVDFLAHACVADQVARVLHREQVLAGGHRIGIVLRELVLQLVVERVAGLLVPEQRKLFELPGVGDCGRKIETSVGIDRELRFAVDFRQHRLDAPHVLLQRCAADLLLDHREATIDVAAHFGAQLAEILIRVVIAAGRVHEDARIRVAIAVPLGKQSEQRPPRDLRHRVPHGHVDGADRDRALAVSAGLLVLEHRGPHLVRIEILPGVVLQRFRFRLQDARPDALANQRTLTIATVGIEPVADDRLAIAHHVGHDRDEAQRHLGEIDVCVSDRRRDGLGHFSYVDDADGRRCLDARS